MTSGVEQRLESERLEREQEKEERRVEARARSHKTRKNKTRQRALIAYVRLARSDTDQISVSLLSKISKISQASLYDNFKRDQIDPRKKHTDYAGAVLHEDLCELISKSIIQELHRYIKKTEHKVEMLERVALTVNLLTQYLFRYPSMFNVEGKLPRAVVDALSRALDEAITCDEELTIEQRDDAEKRASYHTTALIGVRRSNLGSHLQPADFRERLIKRSLGEILPGLILTYGGSVDDLAKWRVEKFEPLPLHMTELKSYERLMAKVQLDLLDTS